MEKNLAHYRIEEQIGEGSFATVYRALDTQLERHIALKVLKPFWMSDAQAVARFMQEARLMAKLVHPNIVTIHDVGQADGRIYLAQQFVDGESLSVRLKRGALTWTEMFTILKPIASALAYAHKQGLVHRDIKPQNILLGENAQVYLSDFGLVKATEGSINLSLSTGGLIGTPNYMAPEQWDGAPVSPATDIYSLTCVVVEMLTGKKLFAGDSPSVVMKRHLIDGPNLPETWNKGIPPQINQVLVKGLAQNPEKRFQSAGDFVSKLENLTKPTLATNISGAIADTVTKIPKPQKPAMPPPSAVLTSVLDKLPRWEFTLPDIHLANILKKLPTHFKYRKQVVAAIALLLIVFGGVWFWNRLSSHKTINTPSLDITSTPPLAFVSNRDGNAEIYILDAHQNQIGLTNNPAEDTSPAWSPNHTQVVFSSNRNGHTDIYTWNIKSGELVHITNNKANDTEPAWSPDGRYIAFTSDRNGKREIWIAGPDNIFQATYSPGSSESWEPAWGENGMLFFTSNRDGKREIYYAGPKGIVQITHSPNNTESWSPHWIARSNVLFFVSNRNGKDNVFMFSSKEGSTSVTSSSGSSKNISPVGTSNGNFIAFASNRSGNFQIYTLIHGKSEQITTLGSNWAPAW